MQQSRQPFLENVRGIVDANKTLNQAALISLLNPVIRGWVNYHRHCAATETFDRVDPEICPRTLAMDQAPTDNSDAR